MDFESDTVLMNDDGEGELTALINNGPENQSALINNGSENQSASINKGFVNQSAFVNNGYENQPNKCDPGDQSPEAAKVDILHYENEEEADVEEIDTHEYGKESLDISEADEQLNNSAVGNLSLNVNESEIDMLNNSTSDEEEVENDKAEQSLESDTREATVESESDIHCGVCHGYFECPKLLECFHTFCLSCLMKRIKNNHRYIFCPVCNYRSDIPKGGITKLTDNVVVASLVSARTEEQHVAECMVCKLHDVFRISTGQCLDCGDMMCQDCCEKHTYSRLTAKHKVVTLEEIKSKKYAGLHKETKVVFCKQHSEELAEFFCIVCSIPVCRECTMSGHRSHHCEDLSDAVAQKNEAIKEKLDLWKQESYVKLVDDSEESDILITEFEQNEFKKLKDAKDKMISIIEQKYNHCVEKLQSEYDIKRRKYCKHKRNFISSERRRVDDLLDKITFILREGSDVETAMLETSITSAVEHRRMTLSKVRPKLTRKNQFPSVYIYKEHLNVLAGLTFFTTTSVKRDQKEKEIKAHSANAAMHVEHAEVRMKIGKNFEAAVTNDPADKKPKSLLSLTSADFRAPVGRGFPFQGVANSRPSVPGNNRPSLLGEYPGQNLMHEYQDTFSDSSSQSSLSMFSTKNYGNFVRGKEDRASMIGAPSFKLSVLTSLDVRIAADQRVPDISDLTFISCMNFAVADSRNHRLKIFNLNGKFARYIDDPGPMSVTFCAQHLIWSSQFSAVRLYDVQQQKIVRVQRVPQTANHPLASFNNVTFLIANGNMEHSRVDACTIDGSHVHAIQPRDRDGIILQEISQIATRSSDQFVCVDQQMKKVVVNDFDGNFMGEYSRDDFEPGGICITEWDDIFVTDKKRNKLILLNPHGEYIRDWTTLINAPSSVASNGTGRVIVAGSGKCVSLYEYAYE